MPFRIVRPQALVALVLLASACSPAAPPAATSAPAAPTTAAAPAAKPTNPPKPAAAATTAPTTATQPSAASSGTLANVPRNRTLISAGWDPYNQVPSPTTFNPYLNVTLHQRNNLHYTINESLFYSNVSTGEVTPWLAAEMWTYNADYTQATIKLRQGIKWADGQPLTSKDVAFTINMLKQNAPTLLLSAVMVDWVKEVAAPDPTTVVITLTRPGPRWVNETLATGQAARFVVLPEHVWSGQDAKTFGFYDPGKGWPFGTGPYKLVYSGNDAIMFDRRDGWWAKDVGLVKAMPAPERVIYKPAAAEAQAQLYINNDIDVGGPLPKGTFEAARARNQALISWREQGPTWGIVDGCNFRLAINSQQAPFGDAAVRQALNYALNRQQIVNLAYEGGTNPNVAPYSSFGSVQKYVDSMKDVYQQRNVGAADPKKTADLLTQKGFKKGPDGKWLLPSGEKWPITVVAQQGLTSVMSPIVVQQLNDAGFDAVAQNLQTAAFSDAVQTGNYGTALWVICGSVDDPWQTLRYYHGKLAPEPGQKGSEARAVSRYKNPQLDALLDRMETMVPSPADPAYVDLAKKATDIFLTDLPDVILAEEIQTYVLNTTYWKDFPSEKNPYATPLVPWDGFAPIVYRIQPAR